jgi:ribosomal protein S18 acetylase RimI-like enzyme
MVRIRKARESDLKTTARIFKEVFNERPWNDGWTKERALKRMIHESKASEIFLCVENGSAIGMVIINKSVGPKYDIGEIKDFAILREYRNKGIGSEFLKEIERLLQKKGYKRTYLETYNKSKALDFYKKNKYKLSRHTTFKTKKLK